jgi:hypothetical protein
LGEERMKSLVNHVIIWFKALVRACMTVKRRFEFVNPSGASGKDDSGDDSCFDR